MRGLRRVCTCLGSACLALLASAFTPDLAASGDDRPPPLKLTGWPRQLSWDDFRVVEGPAESRFDRDAGFYSTFDVTNFEYWRSAPGVFQVRSVSIEVMVEENRWVRRGRQSPALLGHEQGHFDITGLSAHCASRAILRLRGDSVDSLREKGKQIVRDQAATCARWNKEYDEATNHGLDRRAQQRWADRIAKAIRDDYASLDEGADEAQPAEPEKKAARRKGR
ncbi:MAG: DUF922 domain-containing protein [Isosphaeraceae bacterium]